MAPWLARLGLTIRFSAKQLTGQAKMANHAKIRGRILSGSSDRNIDFDDMLHLLERLGFAERIKGDHHILTKGGIAEIVNLQPKGKQAKPYQVRQVRGILVKYGLGDVDVS